MVCAVLHCLCVVWGIHGQEEHADMDLGDVGMDMDSRTALPGRPGARAGGEGGCEGQVGR